MKSKTFDILWIATGGIVAFLMSLWYGDNLGFPGYFMGALSGFLGFFGVALTFYKTCKFLKRLRLNSRFKK
jgi:uncharacterized membrane protein YiaA